MNAFSSPDLWQHLKKTTKTVVLYGMGDGADKILAQCEKIGVTVKGVFASDGFVTRKLFHGMPIRSFDETVTAFGADSLLVLIAFGTHDSDVLANMKRVASLCETYIPDLPLAGDEIADESFFTRYEGEITRCRSLWADEDSRAVYDALWHFKRYGDWESLEKAESFADVLLPSFRSSCREGYLDLGAYDGDTVREQLQYGTPSSIVAFEPDPKNFDKLTKNLAATDPLPPTLALRAGAWKENTVLSFDASGNRNASFAHTENRHAKILAVPAVAPDSVCSPLPIIPGDVSIFRRPETISGIGKIGLCKLDVEGAEEEALLGMQQLLLRDAPDLIVSAYHRTADLFRLPLLLSELQPAYRFYLRKGHGVPAWDINLYAKK